MKTVGKCVLWILGIFVWIIFFIMFWMADTNKGSNVHSYVLIITGICLVLYIWRKTDTGAKKLEQRVQELEKENQTLRRELQDQAVRHAMDKTDKTN